MSDDGLYQQTRASLGTLSRDLQQQLDEDLTAFRTALDQRLAALSSVVRRNDGLFNRAAEDLTGIARQHQQAADEAKRRADDADARLTALRAELESARATFETRLAAEQALGAEAAAALADARQEIATLRGASEKQSVALDEAGRRVRTLEVEHAEWTLARQVAEAHLEEERQRRKTVAIQLETAHEELRLARAEVKSYRLQVEQVAERVSRFEEAQAAGAPAGLIEIGDPVDRAVPLNHIRKDLQALTAAQSADAMLKVLLDSLSKHFETAALFAVCETGLKLWRGRQHGVPVEVPLPIVPLASESTLGRAFRSRTTIVDQASNDVAAVALLDDRPVRLAAAFPVVSNDRVLAIAYVDDTRDCSATNAPMSTAAVEILIDRLNERLQRTPSVSVSSLPEQALPAPTTAAPETESVHYVLTRQARRVPIHDGVKVFVDGVASELVDLSTLGAQIVSPSVIRPNRAVRMVLGRDQNPIDCKARIVWARVERSSQDELVLYRAGVEFTEANAQALQAFAAQYGAPYTSSAVEIQH